ncbi:MAG TPA: UxaA family hydrolase [Bauldia sp.]|nr:UxaA family hydrolase [Bauldia sp.]
MTRTAPAIIVVKAADTVGVACRPIAAGETVTAAGTTVTALAAVPRAHKIALRPIAKGEQVVRAGVPIGRATAAIAAGEHVHTQNLASDYMPTFTFDGPLRFVEDAS